MPSGSQDAVADLPASCLLLHATARNPDTPDIQADFMDWLHEGLPRSMKLVL